MRSDQMVTLALRAAWIPTNHPTWTPANVLQELWDVCNEIVEHCVTLPRNGYWQQSTIRQAVAGQQSYRVPHRAVVGTIEKLEMAIGSSGDFFALDAVTENHAQFYESFGGRNGQPIYYVIRGDQIDMLPTPDSTNYFFRITYYVKPSQLVTSQSSTVGGDAVVRGLITAVNPVARTITVNVVPFDQLLTVPAAITTNNQRIDVVHPNGSFELALVSATQTLAGSVFTVGGTDDMTTIEVGDFVRAEMQTDWPPLPSEFHRMVCNMGGANIATFQGNLNRAQSVAAIAGGSYTRFQGLINQPRTRRQPKRVPAKLVTRSYTGSRFLR